MILFSKDETVPTIRSWSDLDAAAEAQEILRHHKRTKAVHSTDVSQPLKMWLTNNTENARAKMSKSESTRLELERRQDELCNTMSMNDILWDSNSGWETMHRYICREFIIF